MKMHKERWGQMGTGHCAKTRRAENRNVHSGTEVRVNSGAKRVLAAIAAVAMVFLAGGAVAAELPPPNFMPGFPMIAGPQLMIMWQPVPGAAKYKVFINGKEAAESVAFQAFLPAPEKAGSYEIQVQAVAADGAAGKLSDKKIVKIIKLEPPKGLTGRAMENGYALRWDAAPGAMVYNVYRSLKPGADYAILASVQDTRHVDTTAATVALDGFAPRQETGHGGRCASRRAGEVLPGLGP